MIGMGRLLVVFSRLRRKRFKRLMMCLIRNGCKRGKRRGLERKRRRRGNSRIKIIS